MAQESHFTKSTSRKVEPYVVVLDLTFINPEDTNLIALLLKIAQTNTKIVVIGNEVPPALQEKLLNVHLEAISLQNLTANKNQYAKDKTFCFMLNSTSIKTIVQLGKSGAGFECAQHSQENIVAELQSFHQTHLNKPAFTTGGSNLAKTKSTLSQTGYEMFSALNSVKETSQKQTGQSVKTPVVTPQKIEQLPIKTSVILPPVMTQSVAQSTSEIAVKGIVIEAGSFEKHSIKLYGLMGQAQQQDVPVIVLCGSEVHKSSMSDWLKSNYPKAIAETPAGLPSCLSQLSLNSGDCLNLAIESSPLYHENQSTILYTLLTEVTDFDAFLKPGYKLPKKVQQQSVSAIQQIISSPIVHQNPVITQPLGDSSLKAQSQSGDVTQKHSAPTRIPEVPQVATQSTSEIAVKGIVIDPDAFYDMENYHEKLKALMTGAHEKKFLLLCFVIMMNLKAKWQIGCTTTLLGL